MLVLALMLFPQPPHVKAGSLAGDVDAVAGQAEAVPEQAVRAQAVRAQAKRLGLSTRCRST